LNWFKPLGDVHFLAVFKYNRTVPLCSIKTLSIVKNNGGVEFITKGQNYTMKDAFLYKERYKRKFVPNGRNDKYNRMMHKFLSYCDKGDIIKWIK